MFRLYFLLHRELEQALGKVAPVLRTEAQPSEEASLEPADRMRCREQVFSQLSLLDDGSVRVWKSHGQFPNQS
jgi:hypothetical protein